MILKEEVIPHLFRPSLDCETADDPGNVELLVVRVVVENPTV